MRRHRVALILMMIAAVPAASVWAKAPETGPAKAGPAEAAMAKAAAVEAAAELPRFTLPPVRVEGRRPAPAAGFPGARTVLGREWLAAHDPLDLGTALRRVAGLHTTESIDGVGASVSIRGLRGDRIAVLLDGRPLGNAQGGAVDLSQIDLEDLQAVEIARGAVGALFGPDALAGAVNLVRDDARDPRTSLRLIGGTQGRTRVGLQWGSRGERWRGENGLGFESLSFRRDGLRTRSRGGFARTRWVAHPSWAGALEFGGGLRMTARDLPGRPAFPTPSAELEDRTLNLHAGLHGWITTMGALDFDLSADGVRRDYRDPGAAFGPIADRHFNRRWRAASRWSPAGLANALEVRGEAVGDHLDSTTDGIVRRNRGGVTVLAHHHAHGVAVRPAVRVDFLEGLGTHGGGRLAFSGNVFSTTDLRVGWRLGAGTAFRPPTFDDLFWPARASAAGNPNLDPERAWDLDAGFDLATESLALEFSGFLTRVDDLIQWAPGADGIWRPHNVGRARLAGAEVRGESSLESILGLPISAEASYTLLDARDRTGHRITHGLHLVGRARHRWFIESVWEPRSWRVSVGWSGQSRIPLTAANTKWQDGHLLWHGSLRRQLTRELRVDLEGHNLTDTAYEDVRGYPTSGRSLWLGLRYSPR